VAKPGPKPRSALERFMEHITPIPFSGCWLWEASVCRRGYGQFALDGRDRFSIIGAHRASWILHRGPIPDGMYALHKCDVKICVNPSHLFLGTLRDNSLDHVAKNPGVQGAHNAAKTHCPVGHEYSPGNTGVSHGKRYCRICKTTKTREWLARRRAS
jgi:hypothetical protein